MPPDPRSSALLALLRRARTIYGIGYPLTDAALAQQLGVPPREVIDLAAALIAAGWLVVASCRRDRPGRYLLLPGDDLRAAHDYLASLDRRGVRVLARRSAFRRALDAAEAGQSPDSRGQLALSLERAPSARKSRHQEHHA